MMSASSTRDTLENYATDTRGTRIAIIVTTLILILAVVLLSLVFLQNYSLLLSNLSQFMEKAAGGDLNVSLKQTGDDELGPARPVLQHAYRGDEGPLRQAFTGPGTGPGPAPSEATTSVSMEHPAPAAPADSGTATETPADDTGVLFYLRRRLDEKQRA